MTGRRFLAAALCVPLLVASARVAQVQTALGPAFAAVWDRTHEVEVRVPAATGRIVTSDGVVVAQDVTVEAAEANYRWIEDPPNERWLRGEALKTLTRAERRDRERVLEAEAAVLEERRRVWQTLDRLHPPLRDRRAAVQRKVERVRDAVERERAERSRPANADGGLLATVWRELTDPPRRGENEPLVLAEEVAFHPLGDVPPEVVRLIRDRPSFFRGLRVATRPVRRYPHGDFASHVIGHRAAADEDSAFTSVGKSGVERAYQRTLAGRDGLSVEETRRDGTVVGESVIRHAADGRDVTLTVDSTLQRAAESAVDAALAADPAAGGAALLVMDVETGALRAAASGPRPPAGLYVSGSADDWRRVNENPRRPLLNRVHQMALPPGSVFKLVTAVAACGGGWDDGRELFCRGFYDSPDRERCALFTAAGYGHDSLAMDAAVARSCNVFFFRLGTQLGGDRLRDWAGRCGIGWQTGVDVGGEASGNFPAAFPFPGDVRQAAIGQGAVTMTPLQVARGTAAIANGGVLVTPRLCEDAPVARERIPGVDASNTAVIRRGMRQAVLTGTARAIADLPVAGKTGTAEVGGGRRPHAWFAGYFPAEDPRYAVVAVVEHGGSGGRVAAPMVRGVVEALTGR